TQGASSLTQNSDTSGDGAYSAWMESFFGEAARRPERKCAQFLRLRYDERDHYAKDFSKMEQNFQRELDFFLGRLRNIAGVPTVVLLNWHLRYTGHSQSWTGRGISKPLVETLRAVCMAHGKMLRMVYTIHEGLHLSSNQENNLAMADALIALNPDVGQLV